MTTKLPRNSSELSITAAAQKLVAIRADVAEKEASILARVPEEAREIVRRKAERMMAPLSPESAEDASDDDTRERIELYEPEHSASPETELPRGAKPYTPGPAAQAAMGTHRHRSDKR